MGKQGTEDPQKGFRLPHIPLIADEVLLGRTVGFQPISWGSNPCFRIDLRVKQAYETERAEVSPL